jgi:putative MFS transporter
MINCFSGKLKLLSSKIYMEDKSFRPLFTIPVIVAALGYFVDIYDLLLFSIVRRPSLLALGVPESSLLSEGEFLLQVQMTGLLVGGIIWGIMGDKKGRLSVLFGSILLYSLSNIVNGFVTDIHQYAVLRFIAGIGLAGELGAGITLVSESLPTRLRGYGTTLVATVGLLGAVVANFVVRQSDWRTAFFIGGGLGLLLLITRISVFESSIFLKVKEEQVQRGNFFMLFTKRERLLRFLGCIFIGTPIWYVIGILIFAAPEIAIALGISEKISSGDAVMWSYIGLTVGDLSSGLLSQLLKSRKKVVLLYIILTVVFVLIYLYSGSISSNHFYFNCFLLGIGVGYWALFVTIAAEQFGTNLRSTVATTVPNFIRGTVAPLTMLFKYMRAETSVIEGALWVGALTFVIALVAITFVEETFSRDMNFVEKN